MRAADPAAKLAELLSRPLVKVCGLTREEDVAAAAEAGADLAGFVLVPESPRAAADGAARAGRDALRRRLGRRGRRRPAPISTRCTPWRRARCAAATRRSCATASRSRALLDLPVGGHRSRPLGNGSGGRGPGRARRAGSARTTSARRSRPSDRGRSTPRRRSSRRPGIKDHDKVRRYVEAARS